MVIIFFRAILCFWVKGKNNSGLVTTVMVLVWQNGQLKGSNIKFTFIDSPNENKQLSGKIIRDIYRDSLLFLWLSTNNGLNKLDENSTDISKSTFVSYQHNPEDATSIGSNYTLQIFESADKTLWIGTIGGGLNKMTSYARWISNRV